MVFSIEVLIEALKIIAAVAVYFVWVVRYDNIKKEFSDYKLPKMFRDLVGILKISCTVMLQFDDNNLMFSDLKNIIIIGLSGKLNREDKVSEKLDGQNLMVSWVDGKLKAARNKGHLKNGGKTAPTTSGIANMFSGRGQIKKAFVGAMRDLEKAIGSLSPAQKKKVFGNGTKWMNLEVIYPQTANIIDYDVAEIVFHGTTEYNKSGSPIGYSKEGARMLQGMIQQINQNIQKTFKISRPNFLKLNKVQDFGKKKSTYLSRLNKLQSQYGLKDNARLF